MDVNGKALARAYIDGLKAACTDNKIEHTAMTETVTPPAPQIQRRNEFASSEWLNEFGRGFRSVGNGQIGLMPRAPYDVTTCTITAPAFAAWLAAQGETPSVHIQSWFDAVGVAGAAQSAPVALSNSAPPTAPAKRPNALSTSFNYLVETFKAGQYSTAKDFFKALEKKAGAGSPFDKGIGTNAGSLVVREICKPLSLKTLENNLPKIREAAKMG